MELMSLPAELLVAILVGLDVRDILRCREVCTSFKTLIDDDLRTRYKLELAIAGMVDGPSSTRTVAECLSILHAHQDAWRKLAWTAKEDVPIRAGGVWELYGNVGKLSGNVLAQSEGKRTLRLKQIPSAIRGIEGTEWVIPDVGCNVTEIGMDPSQDLLIVIEHFEDDSQLTYRVHLHLRSLSTGEPHPASPPTAMLTHDPEPACYRDLYEIQTSEKYLGVLMSNHARYGDPSELLIWDWKSGTLHIHLVDVELHSFAFLAPRSLLIGHGGSASCVPHLVVVDLESPQSSDPVSLSEVDYICAFSYPPLEDGVTVLDIIIRSNPGPNWCPSPALGVPFSVSGEDRLFAITFWMCDEECSVLSLVPASTFLRALATLSPGETRREFVWAEWGPCGSRFIDEADSDMYESREASYVYGTTCMTAHRYEDMYAEDESARLRKSIILHDFNQLAVRHRAAGGMGAQDSAPGDEGQSVRVVTEGSQLFFGIFGEKITTSLPYIQRTFMPFPLAGKDEEYNSVMLAEDALLLVSNEYQSRLRYCILSF